MGREMQFPEKLPQSSPQQEEGGQTRPFPPLHSHHARLRYAARNQPATNMHPLLNKEESKKEQTDNQRRTGTSTQGKV
jgi:hypothetical protein